MSAEENAETRRILLAHLSMMDEGGSLIAHLTAGESVSFRSVQKSVVDHADAWISVIDTQERPVSVRLDQIIAIVREPKSEPWLGIA